MRAVTLDYERRRLVEREIPAPAIERDDQVLFRVEEVGVCGTDRELAAFHQGYPPPGESYLVLGHEARGRVIETGAGITTLRVGDSVVPMIRRGCSPLLRLLRVLRQHRFVRHREVFGSAAFSVCTDTSARWRWTRRKIWWRIRSP